MYAGWWFLLLLSRVGKNRVDGSRCSPGWWSDRCRCCAAGCRVSNSCCGRGTSVTPRHRIHSWQCCSLELIGQVIQAYFGRDQGSQLSPLRHSQLAQIEILHGEQLQCILWGSCCNKQSERLAWLSATLNQDIPGWDVTTGADYWIIARGVPCRYLWNLFAYRL